MTTDTADTTLQGLSLLADTNVVKQGTPFHAFDPTTGSAIDPPFYSATLEDVDKAVNAATDASAVFGAATGKQRAQLLRSIAAGLDNASSTLVDRAHLETALPRPRLTGEVARTSGQLRLFAEVVEEGSWVMARIDTADPGRTPPRPDVRSMLRPLGPVAIFGASNFPLAFSVAGGDTASALAGGNPVIVKAHPAHPGTGELVGRIVQAAIKSLGLPGGVFSLLFDSSHSIGAALVQHPGIRAVGFTGSFRGGRALMDLAAERADPIPVYAEMGSTNPVFILPGALAERGEEIATGLHASFTLGGGQFCTKPGLVFVGATASKPFTEKLRSVTESGPAFSLLSQSIASGYRSGQSDRASMQTAAGAEGFGGFTAKSTLFEVAFDTFAEQPGLSRELFGPSTLLVHCSTPAHMLQAAHELDGHLTATLFGTETDLDNNPELLRILESKAGRLIFNAFPTGVEVCHAMVHGGPWPATSDGRSTSVGTRAIDRFTRPVAYQGWPQSALPPALQDENPLGIMRQWNGDWRR